MQDGEEEDAGRGDRGRDVAEDVDLRPPRALRPVAQVHRHAAGLQRGAHRAPHVDRPALAPPALLVAERRQPPLHLRDGAVHGGEVLGRAGRQGPVQLGQRPRGGQGLGALDQVAFELAPQVALEAVELLAVDRRQLGGAVLGRRLGPGRELQGAADPLHVDADHARALALAAEGGDRQPRQVAHLALVARRRSPGGSARAARRCRAARRPRGAAPCSLDPALDRLRLGGAEEPALEEQLEEPPVLLRLGDRRRQRLAEVVAATSQGTCSSAAKASRISEVPTATPSLRSSSQKPSSFAARPGRAGLSALGPYGLGRQASPRPARRPGRCRCGA